MRTGLVVLSVCICLAGLAPVQAQVSVEISGDQPGEMAVRCVTPGTPNQDREISPRVSGATDQEVLWSVEHPSAIANNIDVTGSGVYMLTGWYLNEERVSKYQVSGTGSPLWEYYQFPDFYLPVSVSNSGSVMASTGDITPLNAWLGLAGPTPSWQYYHPMGYKGVDCDVSDNGNYVAVVSAETGGDNGKLAVFDASTPTPVWETDFSGETQVIGVEISEDNDWIIVSTYWAIHVFDLNAQTLFFTADNYSQTKAGIDADAEWLATGDFYGQLHVYQRTATGYVEQWNNYMGGWVTAVDISADGSAVLAGNFVYSPSYAGEVRAFDIGGTLLWSYDQYGDYISSVALCDDGSVGVVGSWGMLDATYGDVFTAFEMSSGDVILQLLDDIDEPGTIFDVAISDDGQYAVCGGKAVHARTFGNGGQIYAIELETAGTPDVTITLTPYGTPISIPASGGSFDFNAEVANNGADPETFDIWTMATLPPGGQYGPIINLPNFTAPASWSTNRDRTQSVPAAAPTGMYTYDAYVGIYPDDIWDEDHFEFEKLAGEDGGSQLVGWECWGENFDQGQSELSVLPTEHRLSAYPNPFNPMTTLSFSIAEAGTVSIKVYDVSGREVAVLVNGYRDAGFHEVTFDASHLASGIYVYQMQAGEFSATDKMVLMK
jgi:hypothetical protein